nr:hypothetical protein Itr_chr06CG15960 [Ipomoea trifida]
MASSSRSIKAACASLTLERGSWGVELGVDDVEESDCFKYAAVGGSSDQVPSRLGYPCKDLETGERCHHQGTAV